MGHSLVVHGWWLPRGGDIWIKGLRFGLEVDLNLLKLVPQHRWAECLSKRLHMYMSKGNSLPSLCTLLPCMAAGTQGSWYLDLSGAAHGRTWK